jgi:hypothetical protein
MSQLEACSGITTKETLVDPTSDVFEITFGFIPGDEDVTSVACTTSEVFDQFTVISFGDFGYEELDMSPHPVIPPFLLKTLSSHLRLSTLLYDLLKLFKLKEREPLLAELKEREDALNEALQIIRRELSVAIRGSSNYNNVSATQLIMDRELSYVRAERHKLDTHCPDWIAHVKVEVGEINPMSRIIKDLFRNMHTLRSAKTDLDSLVVKSLRKITEGGYFQDKRFTTDGRYTSDGGVVDVDKIMKWFDEFPDYLEEWIEEDDLYECGYENPMPTRMGFEWQLLSFPWYRKREQIPAYGNQLFRLQDYIKALKQVLARTIGNLYQHIKDTYFPSIDIQTIASDIFEVKSRNEKEKSLRSLYNDKDLCPSDMHKLCLSIIVDPSGWISSVLIESMER